MKRDRFFAYNEGNNLRLGKRSISRIGKDRNIRTMIMEMEYFSKTSGIRMDL